MRRPSRGRGLATVRAFEAVAASPWAARAGATTPHSITVARIGGQGRCVVCVRVGIERRCSRIAVLRLWMVLVD